MVACFLFNALQLGFPPGRMDSPMELREQGVVRYRL